MFSLFYAQPSLAQAQAAQAVDDVILINIDKTRLKAELRTWPEDHTRSVLIREFPIAIGKADGDKQKTGDNKTPEGIYFSLDLIDRKLPQEKYGPRAIPLNFPNPVDLADKKSGYGIWLHGVGDRRIEDAKVTEGCVAFHNKDIESLVNWLQPHQGLIVISQDATLVNQAEDVEAVKQNTMEWLSAWNSRQLDQYIGFYAKDFHHSEGDYDGFKAHKSNVFKAYKEMSVTAENMRVITHPKYAMSVMNQDFRGDSHYKAIGRKILYWKRTPEGWRIMREVFDTKKFSLVSYSAAMQALSTQGASKSEAAPSNL